MKPGVTPDGVASGWNVYWLGDTPDTAQDSDQSLIFLLVSPISDEVDAFRTSVNMMNAGQMPIDVSVIFFRDSEADRKEVERYNAMFFDTPEGEDSVVKLLTNTLDGTEMEMPRVLRIVLRAFAIEGVSRSVFCLNGTFMVILDGSRGGASLFNGAYTNIVDGMNFESDYVKIWTDDENSVEVIVKKGQPIWPEWTGSDSAETIEGEKFVRVTGVWQGGDIVVPAPTPEG